jgi:hypothetical protein
MSEQLKPGEIFCGKKGDTREVLDCDDYFVRWRRAFRQKDIVFVCSIETWDAWQKTAVQVKAKGES